MKITDEMVMRGQLATNGLKYGLTDAEMRAALEAAVADVPVPKAVKVDAERATEKLKLWFFRDLLDEHRTMLFGLFGMPVSEIRNHGDQNHAFRHVVAALAAPAPEAVKDDWRAPLIEELQAMAKQVGMKFVPFDAVEPVPDPDKSGRPSLQARLFITAQGFRGRGDADAIADLLDDARAALNAEGK